MARLEDGYTFHGECRSCGGMLRTNEYDGECASCSGVEVDDSERRREALRQLHADTAVMLRRMGFLADADWHQHRARVQ